MEGITPSGVPICPGDAFAWEMAYGIPQSPTNIAERGYERGYRDGSYRKPPSGGGGSSDEWKHTLAGQTLPSKPTVSEANDALKKVFTKLGGTVVTCLAVSIFAFASDFSTAEKLGNLRETDSVVVSVDSGAIRREISEAGGIAVSYVDTATNAVLRSARSYADGKSTEAVSAAKDYTDGATNSALVAANAYADGKSTEAVSAAKDYTDGATNSVLVAATNSALVAANAYADGKSTEAVSAAKDYTDGATNSVVETAVTVATNAVSFKRDLTDNVSRVDAIDYEPWDLSEAVDILPSFVSDPQMRMVQFGSGFRWELYDNDDSRDPKPAYMYSVTFPDERTSRSQEELELTYYDSPSVTAYVWRDGLQVAHAGSSFVTMEFVIETARGSAEVVRSDLNADIEDVRASITSETSSIRDYIEDATNDVLVAAKDYTDSKTGGYSRKARSGGADYVLQLEDRTAFDVSGCYGSFTMKTPTDIPTGKVGDSIVRVTVPTSPGTSLYPAISGSWESFSTNTLATVGAGVTVYFTFTKIGTGRWLVSRNTVKEN